MLEQYWALKREVPDAILLYRLGDFYEMFFEDAEVAAPLLGLVLTARHQDTDIEAPMCGVPHHALESYVARLVGGGEEGRDRRADRGAARRASALVARKIVRVVTPGTLVDPDRLDARRANDLAAVVLGRRRARPCPPRPVDGRLLRRSAARRGRRLPSAAPARAAQSSSLFPSDRERWPSRSSGPSLGLGRSARRSRSSPSESPRGASAADLLKGTSGPRRSSRFGLAERGPLVDAAAALLSYARSTQKRRLRPRDVPQDAKPRATASSSTP